MKSASIDVKKETTRRLTSLPMNGIYNLLPGQRLLLRPNTRSMDPLGSLRLDESSFGDDEAEPSSSSKSVVFSARMKSM